jgi:hypothetical protein
MWTSFEIYILEFYLVCWFPYHLGASLFFYKVEKPSTLAKRKAILLELLLFRT